MQQTARRCANEYWQKLRHDILTAAETINIRGEYESITKAVGPSQSKTAPLKSSNGEVITDKGKRRDGWNTARSSYLELYSNENSVAKSALHTIKPFTYLGGTRCKTNA